MKIAFLGIGNVGSALADNLACLGHTVTIAARAAHGPAPGAKHIEASPLPESTFVAGSRDAEATPAMPQRTTGERFQPVLQATRLDASPELSDAVQQQLVQALKQRAASMDRLTLQLHPRHLGALELEFRHDGAEVTVQVQAREAPTRDLIEQAAPRLRHQLAELGVNLGEVTVQEEGADNQRRHPATAADDTRRSSSDEEDSATSSISLRAPTPRSAHDYYV